LLDISEALGFPRSPPTEQEVKNDTPPPQPAGAGQEKSLVRSQLLNSASEVGEVHTVPQKKTSTLDLPSEGGDATLSDIEQCYDIGRVVGDGNFAVVRECRRRDSGQTLAMKIVERSKLIGREHMMQNELSLLGSLCHPRIVRLFAHHHTHTHSYLVMELVSGGDLFEAISESGKFSEAAAGLMVSDVSEALSYIHSKSIVHRDLKPENLLVEQAAAGVCRLKLGDFGLAMVVTEPVFTICGTPTYVAPEILCETGYGVEVDVWALGVILYILLCGFPPFRSRDRDQEELFQLIKQGQLHFPSPYWDSISEGEMCRCVFMMEHVNVKAVLKTTCVFVCRSQRPHQSFASARPHSEAGSRADPPAPLGESHGFSLQKNPLRIRRKTLALQRNAGHTIQVSSCQTQTVLISIRPIKPKFTFHP
uniref:Doublecortin-like kinase 3 n=1 Tax=Salarias fasciatus TaxID=181472 RepID=A0A672HWH1_SALFA